MDRKWSQIANSSHIIMPALLVSGCPVKSWISPLVYSQYCLLWYQFFWRHGHLRRSFLEKEGYVTLSASDDNYNYSILGGRTYCRQDGRRCHQMDCSKSDGCRECEQHFDGKVNFSQPHIKPVYLWCVQIMHFELFLDRKAHLDVKVNERLPFWYIYCSVSDKCIFSKLVHCPIKLVIQRSNHKSVISYHDWHAASDNKAIISICESLSWLLVC